MAQERTLGIAGAQDDGPDRREGHDPSKAELQRRMEEARESISSTVTEIKETVAQQVETVKDALDWREHFKKQPVAWSLGALGVGFLTGYCIAATVKGETSDDYASSGQYAYSAQEVRERLYPESEVRERLYPESSSVTPRSGARTSSSGTNGGNGKEEHHGPGLLERFKETSAYDRLSREAGTLGDRLVEELSTTAQTVVLPLLLAKVKNWIGLDLSEKQQPQRVAPQTNRSGQESNQSSYEPVLERPS